MLPIPMAYVHAKLVRERIRTWLKELVSSDKSEPSRPEAPVSLYLHVPFCPNLCKFCHFVKYPFREDLAVKYYKKLIEDVREAHSKGYEVREVYIGGGSPSVLPYLLGELVDVLWELWRVPISLEVNPGDVVHKDVVEHLDPKKVKRISMGVQSFEDRGLRALGRPLNADDTIKAIDIIRSKSYECFNIDMIWGTRWLMKGVERAFSCGANQITFYPLMPFPLRGPKGEMEGFNLYEEIVRMAHANGFKRVNAWTFSRVRSLVDEYIADSSEFLGLGVSSFSLLGNMAHLNTFSLKKYFESGWFPVEHSKPLSDKEMKEFLLAYKLHSNPRSLGLSSEFGWYLGVVTLREMYTVLGEFRVRTLSNFIKEVNYLKFAETVAS